MTRNDDANRLIDALERQERLDKAKREAWERFHVELAKQMKRLLDEEEETYRRRVLGKRTWP